MSEVDPEHPLELVCDGCGRVANLDGECPVHGNTLLMVWREAPDEQQ